MRTINTKIFTLLIVGVMALTATAVFAAKNYNSSKSNTSSIAIIDQQVGDMLLRYGAGGAEINKVTDALAVGIDEIALKAMLSEIGVKDAGIIELFTKLDELGAGFIKLDDEEKAISTSGAKDILIEGEEQTIGGGFKSVSGMDSATAIQPATAEEPAEERITPDTGDVQKEYDAASPKLYEKIAPVIGAEDIDVKEATPTPLRVRSPLQAIDSFFDVYTELEIFIEIIAKNANITKTDARRVVDVLMKASPAFTIDENGLQEEKEAKLIAVVIIGALRSEPAAKRALDAFVNATAKSLRDSDRVALVGLGSFSISKRKARTGKTTYQNITLERGYLIFQDVSENIIQNIKSVVPKERENLIEELQTNRETFRTEIILANRKIHDNAKKLREGFDEMFEKMEVTGYCVKCKEKKARLIIAHNKGLQITNRFRSATARFEHIIKRMVSRVGKLETRGIDVSSVTPLIEEAENMSVGNESKLEQLKEKYESLLAGDGSRVIGAGNPWLGDIAKEARVIAQELKKDMQDLHAKLRAIAAVNSGLELVKD